MNEAVSMGEELKLKEKGWIVVVRFWSVLDTFGSRIIELQLMLIIEM